MLNIFVETIQDSLIRNLFEIEIFCNLINKSLLIYLIHIAE